MTITRSVSIDDLTPDELAFLFCEMNSDEQAAFFSTVWKIGRTWPGAGWCMQSLGISEKLDRDGRSAIETLAAHVLSETPSNEAEHPAPATASVATPSIDAADIKGQSK